MRNISALCSVSVLLVALCAEHAAGAIVFLKGSDEPVTGIIQLQDANHVIIQQHLPDGELRMRDIRRAEIEDIIITVSTPRLESLNPDNPTAYRDYAEELAEKRRDPEAAAVSIRLYLIAAYLAPDTLGRSSLLGMSSLARNPAERRKFLAMAYLLDPKHDKRILQEPGQTAPTADTEDGETTTMLIAALRAARRGDHRTLTNMLKRPSFREALQQWPEGLSYDEFAGLPKELSPEALASLLQMELALSRQARPGGSDDRKKTASWSRIVEQDGTDPVPSLTLRTLTQYDPRKCLFRDGKWLLPDAVK